MKKIFTALFALAVVSMPLVSSAAPFVKDSYVATQANATSSFAGHAFFGGNVQFGFGTGLLSIVNGFLSNVLVDFPLAFSNNTLSIFAVGSHGQVQFNENGSFAGDDGLKYDKNDRLLHVGQWIRFSTPSGTPAVIDNIGGGQIDLRGGDNLSGSGGSIVLRGGVGGDVDPAFFEISGGDSSTGAGGNFLFRGGDGSPGNGGGFILEAGNGGENNDGGSVLITAGNGGNGPGQGGDIVLDVGDDNDSEDFGKVILRASGTGAGDVILNTLSSINAVNTYTFPNGVGIFGLLELDQIWSGVNTFSRGASATTSVNFGAVGELTSRSCFNTKNTDGDDISFYFVGTSMVVEGELCK